MSDLHDKRHLLRGFGPSFAAGLALSCSLLLPATAADTAVTDSDTVPRVVGGASTIGGGASMAVIPYGLPQIPPGTAQVGKPDLSGIYWHNARLFQNPTPSTGVGPGISTSPSGLTVHPELETDRLGSRGDYNTPLLRAWAAELVKELGDGEAASRPYFERCLQNNGLLVMWSLGNRGVQILQTPERAYLFFGQDAVRVVHLNASHPADLKPSVNGHSVGHWDTDTLVVDTIGFDGTSDGDRYGTPTSEQMHVVERMSLVHGGQVLEVEFWVDDPLVYTQPWTSVITYSRVDKLGRERVCRESQMFPAPVADQR